MCAPNGKKMREIEADTEVFVSKLDQIMRWVEDDPTGLSVHILFQRSNNKLKIEIESADEEQRRLIYVFYDDSQCVFRSMDSMLDVSGLKVLIELVKRTLWEERLVHNAHIRFKSELYYFVHPPGQGQARALS